jgi:phage tail-like protein
MPADERNFGNSRYVLQLDGVSAGLLQSVEGGNATADVVAETQGTDFFIKKHLGQVKYEEIILRFGLNMEKAFYDWVSAAWGSNSIRKNGAVVTLDYNLNQVSVLEFFNARVTEVSFPASDGASKEPGFLTVRLTPEYTRLQPVSGKLKIPPTRGDKRPWLTSNFRLTIPGLDCARVARIEPITVKHSYPQSNVGDGRDYENQPGLVEFSNLRLTLAAADVSSWNAWFEDFVIKGNCGEDQEKSGSLELLSPDLKTVLARVSLSNLGIFRLTTGKSDDRRPTHIVADLYCQQMSLQILPAQ